MLKTLSPPVSDPERLSTREKLLLLNGSKLNGCKFRPWDSDPPSSEFTGDEFLDDTELHLSKEQLDLFAGWKRAKTLSGAAEPMINSSAVDLVQDVTTDCSVVASLCAVTARAEMLGLKSCLISSISFPADVYPINHKFIYKLNFNGCYRKVEIDDRLPASKTSRALHVFDRRSSETFWPALAEKAYLKVRGGYDFPGSNSGTDLWILTGWIPEQIFLQSDDLIPSAFWKRLFTAFNYGDVLITIGTGKLSHREERSLGLASEHAYAIIGMKEEGSRRLFRIKNPWSQGGVWKGSMAQRSAPPQDEVSHAEEAALPGTFWMDLNDVFQNFVTIYLNWNPGLFRNRMDVHFTWDMSARGSPESFSNNPQYLLKSRKGGSVWLLLSRHYQSFSRDSVQRNEPDPRLQTGYLSLYAFEKQHRVVLASGALVRAPYVDAPNILLRFEMPDDTSYIIVPSEQDMPGTKHAFTLSAFSTNPLKEFKEAEQRYPHGVSQDGAWSFTSSGGNASSSQFHTNPQFKLELPQASDLAIVLETEDPELAVQTKLVWAQGKRIPPTITKRDVLGDSGEYSRGCSLTEVAQVPKGMYTVVCSTFEPNQLGKFRVRVWATAPGCKLLPIAMDEPGMFSTVLPRAVFPYGVDRILAPLFVTRLTRLHVRAQSLASPGIAKASPLKLSLEFGQGSNKFVLSSTDVFVEAFTGAIRIPELDLKPHMCSEGSPGLWLVVERMGGGAEKEEAAYIEAFSSEKSVSFGAWGQAIDEPIERFQERLKIQA